VRGEKCRTEVLSGELDTGVGGDLDLLK